MDKKIKKRKMSFNKKNKIRIWTFSRKLLVLCLFPMTMVSAMITVFSAVNLRHSIEEQIYGSLLIVATSVNTTYSKLYEGDYSVDFVGKVRKGKHEINGDYDLIDGIKEETGYDTSLVFGNNRLITTLTKENGSRANGISVDKEIYSRIMTEKQSFTLRDVDIIGKKSYVYYQPLINSDGSVGGAIEAVTDSESVNNTIKKQIMRTFLYVMLFEVIAAIIVFIMARFMIARMSRISRLLERLINGKLDHQPHEKNLKVNDEIGDIYRNCVKVQNTFKDIVTEIKGSCNNLKSAADRFSDVAQSTNESADNVKIAVGEITSGARTQADSTVEAHDNMELINDQIVLISKEVDGMAAYAEDMSAIEKKAQLIIGELTLSNDITKDSVAKVAEQISLMSVAVNNIKQAVEMIQAIADETDLLSLNASIEAARAGDAGRGFGVVAEQISKLALQSNESGKDIECILAEITDTSEKMVTVMGEVRTNMDVQQEKLEETRVTYKAVAESVEKSLENISNIKKKIDVLNTSSNSIGDVVEDLAAISEENAMAASNTMDIAIKMSNDMQVVQMSSDELIDLADRLQDAVGVFRV